ncbi:MAG: LysR family transcriptional regulator [Pseudomonadota bacterium]
MTGDQRLPPLNALRAFEAAARLESIKLAGEELCVTPAAVSQHIRKLEDSLGVELFIREHNQIVLTANGKALSDCMTSAIRDMRSTIRGLRGRSTKNDLRVTSAPMFFNKFIGPRLWEFKRLNPDINLEFELGLDPQLFYQKEAVIGLVLPTADVPGTDCSDSYWEYQAPMASPEYLRKHRIERPEDLSRAVLLEREYPSTMPGIPLWRDWFAAARIPLSANQEVMSFGPHYEQIYDAALNDIGVFLGGVGVTSKLLQSGRLVCPFGPLMPQGTGVKMVWSRTISANSAAVRFRDWLMREMDEVAQNMLNRELQYSAG